MPVKLMVPSVGESITEVEIGEWLKKPGDIVDQDEPVVVIETEKVTVELPAPAHGKITQVVKVKGDKATVGEVIGYMEPDGNSPSGRVRSDSRQVVSAGEGPRSDEPSTPSPSPKPPDAKSPPSI